MYLFLASRTAVKSTPEIGNPSLSRRLPLTPKK